jgi:hypothetical protein
MGRQKRFTNAAERQRAYRLRVTEKQKHSMGPGTPQPKQRCPPSRPTRIAAIEIQVQQLHDEYESWFESMPEPLQGSDQGQRLSETVEQLSAILELMMELNPPRGFGRD